jgi:Domain of unknown function (DUF4390)
MTRGVWLWLVAGLLASSALVGAAENLRIVPIVSKDDVVVSFDGGETYTDEVRAAISSGLRTTFTYEIELRMLVPAWVDRTIASAVVSVSDQYDNLTRRHSLSRVIDGREQQVSVTEDETTVKQWLTSVSRLPLISTSKLDQSRDYYVRIRARVRPRGTSLLGWTSAISAQTKFTFVP